MGFPRILREIACKTQLMTASGRLDRIAGSRSVGIPKVALSAKGQCMMKKARAVIY
jgi:hypothetical protein